jgi:ribonuclease HI
VFQILFEVSNNKAKYEALLRGLHLAISLGIKRLVYGDSLLGVQQVNKEWDINKDTMDAYVMEIHKLEKSSRAWIFTMWFAITTWARTCSPSWVLIE